MGGIVINREEILSKSRRENKDKDLYQLEVQINAGFIGSLTAVILATVFFITQSVTGNGLDFGLYAIIFSISATNVIVMAVRMKRKRDIILSIVYGLATLILTGIHLYKLFANVG